MARNSDFQSVQSATVIYFRYHACTQTLNAFLLSNLEWGPFPPGTCRWGKGADIRKKYVKAPFSKELQLYFQTDVSAREVMLYKL